MAKLSDFRQDPQNFNLGTDKGNAILSQSLKELGAGRSILVDKHGFIIAGNKTAQAALSEGLEDAIVVPTSGDKMVVVQRTDLDLSTDPRAKQLAIADNRVAELNLSWDAEALAELAGEIDLEWLEIDDSFLAQLEELNKDFAEKLEGLTDEDDIPDSENIETRVKRGDVWQLGRHRVMCGDSTFIDDVDKLMDGEKADMVFTDPPYGVNYEGGIGRYEGGKILSKTASKIDNDLTADIYKNINNILHSVLDCGPVYVWFAYKFIQESYQSIKGMDLRSVIVWYKINQGFGDMGSNYHAVSEFCFYAVKGKSFFSGENNEKNVWELTRPQNNKLHPTQKPTELAERAIQNHDAPKVLDLFLGSGSTLIACEKTGRTCYGMELSEKYCDVILKRWEDFTGQTATLVEG